MRGALLGEWTKLRTLASTTAALTGVVVLTVGLSAYAVSTMSLDGCLQRPGASCDVDTTKGSLVGVHLGQIAVVVLAVLAVTGEYETGTIRTTLAATPRRGRLFAAKALVLTTSVVAAATVAVLGALVAARIMLPGKGFTAAHGYPLLSVADEPTGRAYLGTVAYLGLIALVTYGVATAVRFTGAALTTVLALLYVAPILALVVTDPRWNERILKYSPMTAGLSVQATKRLAEQPIGPGPGLGVLAGYAAGAVLLGLAEFLRRDA